jgi:hypothetical protein
VRKFWMAISGVCGLAALVFLFRQDFDKAFIIAALGAVSWFLGYRVQMKEIVVRSEKEEEPDWDVDSDEK